MSTTSIQGYRRADWDHTSRTRVVSDVLLRQMREAPTEGQRLEIHGRLTSYLQGFPEDQVDAQGINKQLAQLGLPLVAGSGSAEGKLPLSSMPLELSQAIHRFSLLRPENSKAQAVLNQIHQMTGGALGETEFKQAQHLLQHAANC